MMGMLYYVDRLQGGRYFLRMKKKQTLAFPYRQRSILHIDVATETFSQISLTEEEAKQHLGGRLLALWLWQRFADFELLGDDSYESGNPVVFASGAASDLAMPCSNSYTVVTKSPVTGSLSVSVANAPFAQTISDCGFSALVITGRSRRLCSFAIADRSVVFQNAEAYHNLATTEVARKVRGEHLVAIGPAGEHFVLHASIYVDSQNVTHGGVGRVLGMKNIKFFTLKTHKAGRESYDAKLLGQLNQKYLKDLGKRKLGRMMAQNGDRAMLSMANRNGWAAIDNYSMRVDGRLWSLTPQEAPPHFPLEDPSCPVCESHDDLDLETSLALGANLELFDKESVRQLAERCLENGLDPVSTGATLSWARACRLEGKLSFLPDMQRCSVATYLRIIDAMAYCQGTGEQLSLGLIELVGKYGGAEHAYAVEGLPLPPFDYRALPVQALLASLGDNTLVIPELLWGNHYRRGNERRLARWAVNTQKLAYAYQSVGLCTWIGVPSFDHLLFHFPYFFNAPKVYARLAHLAGLCEGYKVAPSRMKEYGEKALQMQLSINDRLKKRSGRFGKLPDQLLVDGKSSFKKNQVVPLARLLDAYWSLLGRK